MATPNIIDHTPYQGSTINHQFEGRFGLVKFTNGPPQEASDVGSDSSTVWLYDVENKVYIPILSWGALKNAFPTMSDEDLVGSINLVDTSALQHDDFRGTFLTHEYGIPTTGLPKKFYQPAGNKTGTALSRYGQEAQPEDVETNMGNILGVALTSWKRAGGISEDTFNRITKDPTTMARYMTASLYGGYTFDDIFRDAKAKELAASGNQAYANFKAIDDNSPAYDFYHTAEGQKSKSDQLLAPPPMLGMDQTLFDLPISKISANAFATLVPPVDWTDPKFKDEADKIQAGWFDIMNAKMTADTEQAKMVADQNYADFIRDTKAKYGIQLSNNAREAYSQLMGMFEQGAQRGIANSGVIDEMMQRKLQDTRANNEYLRTSKENSLQDTERQQLLQYGTPAQIKTAVDKMNAEDQAKGIDPAMYRSVLWGLVPSAETKNFFSIENLRKVYPEMSDEDLQRVKNLTVDSNGNYMSGLYQKLYQSQFNLQGTGTEQMRDDYQQNKLFQKKLDEEKKAYAPYTGGNPFSSYQPTGDPNVAPKETFGGTSAQQNAPSAPTAPSAGTGFQSAANPDVIAGQAADAARRAAASTYKPDPGFQSAANPDVIAGQKADEERRRKAGQL